MQGATIRVHFDGDEDEYEQLVDAITENGGVVKEARTFP